MTKWGHLARLIINSKQKLGLGYDKIRRDGKN